MHIKIIFHILFLTLISSCGGGGSGENTSNELILETEVSALNYPIRIGELDDDKLIISELNTGNIIQYDRKNKTSLILTSLSPGNNSAIGIAGLLIDKDFNNSKFIFIYHLDSRTNKNIITRLKIENSKVTDTKQILFLNSPAIHNGGGMMQNDDGIIFLGIGDGNQADQTQVSTNYYGKIIAFDREGNLLNNNDVSSGIYASGIRNPFGLTGNNDKYFFADNGPTCDDEVNLLLPNNNYGWRKDYTCGESNQNFTSAIYSWSASSGLTDILIYTKSKLNSLTGKILVGKYNTNSISVLTLDDNKNSIIGEDELFLNSPQGPFIDFLETKSGDILITTPTSILRVSQK